MTSERKFIEENVKRVLLKEYLKRKTERSGFGGLDIQRTPMGTRVTLIAERPGMVIGRKGETIKELTDYVQNEFKFDNPQIEVKEETNPNLNPHIMAQKLATALERGWHFRRAGHSTVRRIMSAGAKGCQVIISGKLTGQRHRTEKFREGHIKYCGESKLLWMREGYAVAKKKLGIIGIKVQIMAPNAKLPDEIEIRELQDVASIKSVTGEEVSVAAEQIPEQAVEAGEAQREVPVETSAEITSDTATGAIEIATEAATDVAVDVASEVEAPEETKEAKKSSKRKVTKKGKRDDTKTKKKPGRKAKGKKDEAKPAEITGDEAKEATTDQLPDQEETKEPAQEETPEPEPKQEEGEVEESTETTPTTEPEAGPGPEPNTKTPKEEEKTTTNNVDDTAQEEQVTDAEGEQKKGDTDKSSDESTDAES